MSCEDIEHGILRDNRGHPYVPGPHFATSDPRFAWRVSPLDVRIHFALNCASRSCPPIGVYDAAQIDTQLELVARRFVSHVVEIDQAACELYLSRIFSWYAADFGGREGVIAFVLPYLLQDEVREWLVAHHHTVKVTYLPYDWALNVV